MSEYFGDSFSADFVFNSEGEPSAEPSLRGWAEQVFADPLSLAHRIQAELYNADYIPPEYEAALYLDWQARDTELGYRLLEKRREELLRAVEVFRAALARKRKAIVLARTRMDALQKINAAEVNPSLRHPDQIFAQLDAEVRAAQTDLQGLRHYIAPIEALDSMLRPIIGGVSNEDHHLAEQRMRLLGQSWRGWMRVRANRCRFPARQYKLPAVSGPAPLFEGLVIPHTEEAPSPLATDLLIDTETATYLHHCLETIAALSAEMSPYFQSENRPQFSVSSWPNLMILLRAIVEFFYFCGFELPVLSNSLIVDLDNPAKLWIYRHEQQEWQAAPEETLSNRLKRDSATVAHLLISTPSLPGWRTADDLSARLHRSGQDASAKSGLQPYRSMGLARLDISPHTRSHKFQTAYKLTGKLIEQLISADTHLAGVFQSPLGGGLETITGMALLDLNAFKLAGAVEPLPTPERFRWLSHFWKTMGKRRPLALLGDHYAKEISAGLTALGEPAPERSSMLSIHLSTLLSRTALGQEGKPAFQDLLTVLMLADQIRLVELLNGTWAFTSEIATHISTAEDGAALSALIASLPSSTTRQEDELSKRFNKKWLTAQQPIWGLLRGCAPAAWDFWAKISNRESWIGYLSGLAPAEAFTALLHLCADVIRMMVLLESCSPLAAERLSVDAETAGRTALTAFQRCQSSNSDLSSAIAEAIRYYYDAEVTHDAWIAFTSSTKTYLQHLHEVLKQLDSSGQETTMFANVLKQLELHYPTPVESRKARRGVGMAADDSDLSALMVKPATIDENDARAIESLSGGLLGQGGLDRLLFLKLFALLQSPESRGLIHFFSTIGQPLRESFSEARHRRIFFSTPTVLRDTAQFLTNQLQTGSDLFALPEETRAQLHDYLSKLDAFQRYAEASLGGSPLYQSEDHSYLYALDIGARANLILFAVLNRPFCALARQVTAQTLARFQEFLQEKASGQLSDWKPEYSILGSVGLRRHADGLAITGTEIPLDPIFVEPEKALSGRLLITFLRSKYQLVSAILKQEMPDQRVMIQPN